MASVTEATETKTNCVELFHQVVERREVTKSGKLVAYLLPVAGETSLFGALAGSVIEEANIVGSINVKWVGEE